MDRPCDICGTQYLAKRATSKYCSTRCRTRASRGADVITLPEIGASDLGSIESATRTELITAERLDTAMGQTCLALARRLDLPGVDTGSAMASVAARLEDLLVKATRGAGAATAPQQLRDELAQRRTKHA